MNCEKVLETIKNIAKKIEEHKNFLTKLDNDIGDGDHGINLSRGFNAVVVKLPTLNDKDIGTILKTVGMTLVSTVGGASGPLFGTAFMKMGDAVKDQTTINIKDFANLLDKAIEGVKMRGKSQFGEKTMIDAMVYSYQAVLSGLQNNLTSTDILSKAVNGAKKGVEYTKTIAATKGRASYLGDRSIGFQDPGATSVMYILEAVKESV